jgi:hypothetical protein
MSSVINISDLSLVPMTYVSKNKVKLPTLIHTDSSGSDRYWNVFIELLTLNDEPLEIKQEYYNNEFISAKSHITSTYGKLKTKKGVPGVETTTVPTIITSGSNIGKANQTNVWTQALRDAIGMYNKQIVSKQTKCLPITEDNIVNKRFNLENEDQIIDKPKSTRGPKPKPKDGSEPVKEPRKKKEESVSVNSLTGVNVTPVIPDNKYYPPMLLSVHSRVEVSGDKLIWKEKVKEIDFSKDVSVQPKFDGLRCVALYNEEFGVSMYTRKLKDIIGFIHLRSFLLGLYKLNNIITLSNNKTINFQELYLDGEIYHHGMNLQDINSIVRKQNNSPDVDDKLEFYIFDCFLPSNLSLTFTERQEILSKIKFGSLLYDKEFIKIVPTFKVNSNTELNNMIITFIKNKYEGGVIKLGEGPYEFGFNNKRSSYNLKVKQRFDEEYKIVGFTQGSKGNNLGAIIWILSNPNGKTEDTKTFNAVPKYEKGKKDVIELRKQLFAELTSNPSKFEKEYKNQLATVEFEDLSKDGVPLRAKFIGIRDDI